MAPAAALSQLQPLLPVIPAATPPIHCSGEAADQRPNNLAARIGVCCRAVPFGPVKVGVPRAEPYCQLRPQ